MPQSSHSDSPWTELATLLGDRLSRDAATCQAHAGDASHHRAEPPPAVAFPRDQEEVVQLVRLCARHRLPLIPYGTGTAVEGGIVAQGGGLCVDTSNLNRIIAVEAGDMDATVEAGVTRHQLNDYLADHHPGLHFPIDPGADASLGGMASTRASGTAAVRYGTMRDNVLGLTAVLGDGRLIHTGGRARKSSAGYDLTALLVGSEGTLGLITQLTLRLAPLPEAVSAAVCPFASVAKAVDAAIEIIGAGIPVARLEMLDAVEMDAVVRYADLPYAVAPTLFFEFHGSDKAVVEQAEKAGQIARQYGGANFHWATEENQRRRLWQARHDGYHACMALRPGSVAYITDVCVPISQLATCIEATRRDLDASELIAPLFGHVGDGNFHVVFPLDPNAPNELEEAKRLGDRMVERALEAGGTCTGEHGIGLGKLDALEREAGEGIETMRAIKAALDPNNIMNPGKVLRG
ncbi:MAG: FAD-binding protein [Candidatus Latescibacteria bacterium]|nr:FAD-binding protein [Candidatus Latescibacterota bacterium]